MGISNGLNKIIFDIETVGDDFEKLAKDKRDYLLKSCETEKEKEEAKAQLSLWPLTSQIVAIAMLNPDTDKGAVYFQAGGEKIEAFSESEVEYRVGSEEEIIKWFWKAMAPYNQFITFNGRGFDAPFLMLRSAVHKISPGKNLMPYRYSPDIHLDLLDQMTFYGTTRRFSLDFYARSFGIKSPKEGGVNGSEVGRLYKSGEYKKIAKYCFGDVVATKKLYEVWRDYINISSGNY